MFAVVCPVASRFVGIGLARRSRQRGTRVYVAHINVRGNRAQSEDCHRCMIQSLQLRSSALFLGLVLVMAGCAGGTSLSVGRSGVDGAELVAFVNGGAVSRFRPEPARVLLDSLAEADAFAEGFAGGHPQVASRLRTRMSADPPRRERVLLGFSGLGCAEDSAELRRADGGLDVAWTGGERTMCAAASLLVAVFAVDRTELPGSGPLAAARP